MTTILTSKHSLGRQAKKRRMAFVFALTTAYMCAEAIGGFITGSLALIADAGHMLTDAGALGLALFAMSYAERSATSSNTFGFQRAEVLAAFSNAALLLLISLYILYEAIRRLFRPLEVTSTPMLVIAGCGLMVNILGMYLLKGASKDSFNTKAAYLEVLSDALGSIGVICAAVIIKLTKWYVVDPIFGAAIGLFIIPRTLKMLKDTSHVLMEGAPSHINLKDVELQIKNIAGVVAVHDLHVWTLTSEVYSVTGHVCIEDSRRGVEIMTTIRRMLTERYGISHSTIQVEDEKCRYRDLDF